MRPQTKYARSGDVHIAYQALGNGPLDLVFSPGWVTHLEGAWDYPPFARFYERLASFSRLIILDRRGTGLSDRVVDTALPTLEERMDDLRAVLDAVGSQRAGLFGVSEAGPMSALFAATYPERVAALVLYGSYAKFLQDDTYPAGMPVDTFRGYTEMIEQRWGEPFALEVLAPSMAADPTFRSWWGRQQRLGASPGAALALLRMAAEIDVRHVLPAVHVPTLVLHRTGDRLLPVSGGRYLAQHILHAKYVEFAGDDHPQFLGDVDALLGEVQEFLTGARHVAEPDRVLATVMFTDIVGSTERAHVLGDRRWRDVLEGHHAVVRRELARHRGREVDTAGDGFFAVFDGPARAIRCACAIRDAVAPLGIAIRAGLHTGECEVMGDKLSGIAVHIGARVAGNAASGEVLVSSTVKDLVAGSGLAFTDRGVHALKGVPGRWQLFAVDR